MKTLTWLHFQTFRIQIYPNRYPGMIPTTTGEVMFPKIRTKSKISCWTTIALAANTLRNLEGTRSQTTTN
jgi:hypothetical protein